MIVWWQTVIPENIHITNITWTQPVILENICVYTNMCIRTIAINKKEAMYLKNSGECYMGDFGGRKEKGEMYYLN